MKTHSVHYSLGRAGRYMMHVRLRQQGARLQGSPFELEVSPGTAHAAWTSVQVEHDRLPLRGIVGEPSVGVKVLSKDRMANRCLVGGALVRVSCDNQALETKCLDNDDGTYVVHWFSKVGGTYSIRISIDGVDVAGSPTPLLMLASKPDVNQFTVSGDGLVKAVAGKPAAVRVQCKDAFGNLCALSSTDTKWGMQLLPLSEGRAIDDAGAVPVGKKSKKGEGGGGGGNNPMAAGNAAQKTSFESIKESMPFAGKVSALPRTHARSHMRTCTTHLSRVPHPRLLCTNSADSSSSEWLLSPPAARAPSVFCFLLIVSELAHGSCVAPRSGMTRSGRCATRPRRLAASRCTCGVCPRGRRRPSGCQARRMSCW